jgi:hypothetical protein
MIGFIASKSRRAENGESGKKSNNLISLYLFLLIAKLI